MTLTEDEAREWLAQLDDLDIPLSEEQMQAVAGGVVEVVDIGMGRSSQDLW